MSNYSVTSYDEKYYHKRKYERKEYRLVFFATSIFYIIIVKFYIMVGLVDASLSANPESGLATQRVFLLTT